MNRINYRIQLETIPEVLCTPRQCPHSTCVGIIGCGDTMCSQKVGHRRLQPLIGPYGGQWTMCALPREMQPQPHSEVPVHFGAIRAGDLIHHSCLLVSWYRVLGVNQVVAC